MKSNRVTLESPEDINNPSNPMKRLREKFRDQNLVRLQTVDYPEYSRQLNPVEIPLVDVCPDQNNSELPTIKTPQKQNFENFSFSKSALMLTKEETDLKNLQQNKQFSFSGSAKPIVRLLDLKILDSENEKNTRLVSCLKSTKKEKFSLKTFSTINPQIETESPRLDKTYMVLSNSNNKINVYPKEPTSSSKKRVSSMLMPRPGEFQSQISLREKMDSPYEEFEISPQDYGDFSSISNSFSINSPEYSSMFGSVEPFKIKSIENCSLLRSNTENNTALERKVLKLNLRSPGEFKNFGLKLNSQSDTFSSPSHASHPYLPMKYKNDERYKKKLINFLRGPQGEAIKTETQKFNLKRKFSQAFDGNLSKFCENFGGQLRKVNSEKKIFESHIAFYDNRALQKLEKTQMKPISPQYFKYYYDKQIGFSAKWQHQLKNSDMDDDVETDEDQLRAADRHTSRELGDGIRYYLKNKNNVRNINLLKL
jgi:hypothetical protein